MSVGRTTTPRISQLAEQLEEEIQIRALQPGDRFLTTADASRLLGVGNSAANRALQLLERRRVIVRQQRSGAFIASPQPKEPPMLSRVHFLVHQRYLVAEGVGQDHLLLGIEHELPSVNVQISFLPLGNELGFVQDLISESLSDDRPHGFVLVRASYETQRLLSELDIPTVVYGTLYPSIERLASLTEDMRDVGRRLTDYLLSRGHQRIAHFSRQTAYQGDHWTIEGIASRLHEAGRGFDSLSLHLLPDADDVYLAEAKKALDAGATGFVCRTMRMAEAVRLAAEASEQIDPKDVDITVCNFYQRPGIRPKYVHARAVIGSEEQGRHLARLLLAQARGHDNPRIEIMPIELEFPS